MGVVEQIIERARLEEQGEPKHELLAGRNIRRAENARSCSFQSLSLTRLPPVCLCAEGPFLTKAHFTG